MPFAHNRLFFPHCVIDLLIVYSVCNSVVCSHCYALSWPGRNCKLLSDHDGLRANWEFSQDTWVNTPTLTISAMGSLVNTESQDTCLTSHPKDSALHSTISPTTAVGNYDIYGGPLQLYIGYR